MTGSSDQIALVAGGAGFIGANLSDRLIADGARAGELALYEAPLVATAE